MGSSSRDRISDLKRLRASSLTPHPQNYRTHPGRQRTLLSQVLQEIGVADALLVREHQGGYQILDGHLRADLLGDQLVPCLVLDLDLDDQEAQKLLLTLDPLASLAETDSEILADLLRSTETTGDLDAWLRERAEDAGLSLLPDPSAEPPEVEPDRYAEVHQRWPVQTGDLWQLGRHRLLCADSLSASTHARLLAAETPDLVLADPPYGISIHSGTRDRPLVSGGSKIVYKPFAGDQDTATARGALALLLALAPSAAHVWWGAQYYCDALGPRACWLVWDKVKYWAFADVELAWTSCDVPARIFRHQWHGFLYDSEGDDRWHPTQKPAALASWVYGLFLQRDQIVLDPFGGAGWSLLAAEQTGHRARVVELSPLYCAVICERWHRLTGQTPTQSETKNVDTK
jgi:hypothetical protein